MAKKKAEQKRYEMSKERLTITYEGEALRNGSIDLASLGPALVSISSLLVEANKEIGDKDSHLQVYVDSFQPGSFQIVLEVAHATVSDTIELFSGQTVSATINLLTALGFANLARVGLTSMLKKLRGQAPKAVIEQPDGSITITTGDNSPVTFTVTRPVYNLYMNDAVVEALKGMADPLRREGISKIAIQTNQESQEEIEKNDLPYFSPARTEKIEKTTTTQAVRLRFQKFILPPSSQNTFLLNKVPIKARITDPDFLEKVIKGSEEFTYTDWIEAELKIEETRTDRSIEHEYEIIKVLSHHREMNQAGFEEIT